MNGIWTLDGKGEPMLAGWPRFGLVWLQFLRRTVRTIPVLGSDISSGEITSHCTTLFNRGARFWFRFWFLKNGSTVPVPLSVPEKQF